MLQSGSVFFGYGSIQHGGGGWKANHGLWYRTYLIPENAELIDVIAFACGGSMQHEVRNIREVFLGDVDPQYMSDEKDDDDTDVSKNTATAEMTAQLDENCALNVWPDFSIDAPIEDD